LITTYRREGGREGGRYLGKIQEVDFKGVEHALASDDNLREGGREGGRKGREEDEN